MIHAVNPCDAFKAFAACHAVEFLRFRFWLGLRGWFFKQRLAERERGGFHLFEFDLLQLDLALRLCEFFVVLDAFLFG